MCAGVCWTFRAIVGVGLLAMQTAGTSAQTATYDPSTGSVSFFEVVKPPQGFGYQLLLESAGGLLLPGTTTPAYPVPGASAYEGYLPNALYWDWAGSPPQSTFTVENVVPIGTPVSDLSFGYGYSILIAEITERGLPLTQVPEPSITAIIASVLFGVGVARCRRAKRSTSAPFLPSPSAPPAS